MLLKRSGFGLFIALAIALPGYATTGPYMNTSIGYAALQGPKKLNLRDTIQYSFDQEQHTPLLRFGTGWLFFENFGLEIGYAHLFSKKYQTYVAKSQTSQDNLDIMAVWNVPLSTMFEAKLGVGGSYKQTHYNLDSHLLHKLNMYC